MPSAFALAISGFAWSPQKSLRQMGWPMGSRHSTPTVARSEHFAFDSQALCSLELSRSLARVLISRPAVVVYVRQADSRGKLFAVRDPTFCFSGFDLCQKVAMLLSVCVRQLCNYVG